MASTTLYDKNGKKSSTEQKLSDEIFGLENTNEHLLYLSRVRQQANARRGTAHTLTRSEVRGGGAKPWRQKGTGRARAGSSNSPLWAGGGVIFGPRNNVNWKKSMNKKESKLSLRLALSLVQQDSRLSVIEAFDLPEIKTRNLVSLLKATNINARKILLVIASQESEIKRAASNIQDLKLIDTSSLNVFDLLNADHVVISQQALEAIEKRFKD